MKENFGPAVSEAKEIIGCKASLIRVNAASLKEKVDRMRESLHKAALQSPDSQIEERLRELELIEQQCLNNVALKKDMQTTLHKMFKVSLEIDSRWLCLHWNLQLEGRTRYQVQHRPESDVFSV